MALKNRVKIMKEFNGQLTEVKTVGINSKRSTFRWQGKTYMLDMQLPLHRRKNTMVYAYCINAGQLLTNAEFKKFSVDGIEQLGGEIDLQIRKQTIDESVADQILDKHVFRDLGGQVMKSGIFDAAMIGYIIMAAMGVFAGLFCGKYFL